MSHSVDTAGQNAKRRAVKPNGPSHTVVSGSEWDSEVPERIDDRDAENIDLDIECINESLARKFR